MLATVTIHDTPLHTPNPTAIYVRTLNVAFHV